MKYCTFKTSAEKNGLKVGTMNDDLHSVDGDASFDSDDEMSDECSQDRLSWRKDVCFSDWTIVIKVAATRSDTPIREPKDSNSDTSSSTQSEQQNAAIIQDQVFTYTVHKTAMAVGSRRSEYFVRLFDGKFAEAQDCTSRIELNDLTAKAFPLFLDYLYGKTRMQVFTAENATALYSLAKYFDVRRLRHEVKRFILQDMQPSGDATNRMSTSCSTYYKHAKVLHEDAILQAASKCFRVHLPNVKINWHMALVTDHVFWLDLMNDEIEKNGGSISSSISRKLSCYIAHYCNLHHPSPQVFQQLTDEKYLVSGDSAKKKNGIHPKAAVFLLDSERKILGQKERRNPNETETESNGPRLSSLQIRCVNAIVRGKKKAKLKDLESHFQKFSPVVLREIITRSFYGIPEEP